MQRHEINWSCLRNNPALHILNPFFAPLCGRLSPSQDEPHRSSPIFQSRTHRAERVGTHLEGDRQRLVAPPVGGQDRAQKVGAVGAHQLGRVVGDDLGHAAVLVGAQPRHRRRVRLPSRGAPIVHLPWDRLEAVGRRTEPPAGAGIYGNAHHNSVDDQNRKQAPERLLVLFLSLSHTHARSGGERVRRRRRSLNLSASANGKWDWANTSVSGTVSTTNFSGRLQKDIKYTSPARKNNPWKRDDV